MNAGRSRSPVDCLHDCRLTGCLLVALVALAVLTTVLAAVGGVSLLAESVDAQPQPGSGSQSVSGAVFVQQDAVAADEIRITVALYEDGSATWSLGFWRVLDDDDSRAAFDSLRSDIESDPENYTTEFADRIERTVDAASNATGREMAVDNVTVTTDRQSLAREYGVVRYRFEWAGFAAVDGEDLYAGDAVDRLYLDDNTRLLMGWPEGYDIQSVTPAPDDRRETAVLWRGSNTEFISGEPRVVVTPAGLGAGTLAGILGLIAVLTGTGGWLLRRRSADEAAQPAEESDAGAVSEEDEPVDEDSTGEDQTTEPESVAEPPAEQSTDESTEGAAGIDLEPDSALLSNEEQVMQLLEANGGRMKQQTVVEELGWTDAKTSKVVSGMREEGTIESFRIGRENVLTTPEDDPRDLNP